MTDTTTQAGVEVNDGRVYWRSMEQLSGADAYRALTENEFPEGITEPPDEVSRRGFLGVIAAAVAMAGATGCRKPYRKILPFAQRPEDMVPGVPNYYASSFTFGGYASPVVMRSSDGRPTKVEGNGMHPASFGGTSAFAQGELLNLYDPQRSRGPAKRIDGSLTDEKAGDDDKTHRCTIVDVLEWWSSQKGNLSNGKGLAILMRPTTSPTLLALLEEASQGAFKEMSVHTWAPVSRFNELAGAAVAFGKPLDAQYDFTKADVVVAFDSDFLCDGPNQVRYAHDFATTRRAYDNTDRKMSRLYAVESRTTITGGQADHRFRLRASEVSKAAFALAAALGPAGTQHATDRFKAKNGKNWVQEVARDLQSSRGKSIVVAGPGQPAAVHAAVQAINATLGNVGQTVNYTDAPGQMAVDPAASLGALCGKIDAGQVDTLVILGGNPAYDAPADLAFADKLGKVANKVHLGTHRDETAVLCDWHVNEAHDLETWGDIRAFDGTVSIVQPLIDPLWAGVSAIELLAHLIDYDEKEGYKVVRYHWEDNADTDDFDGWWAQALHDGLVGETAFTAVTNPTVQATAVRSAIDGLAAPGAAGAGALDVMFVPSATMFDGRYANNAWMQECPDPVTKLTWDNAALIGAQTAEALGLRNGDVVEIAAGGNKVTAPVWIAPGTADWTVVVSLGWGRRLAGAKVATGAGFDAGPLRTSSALDLAAGAKLTKTGATYELASTQDHGALEDRSMYRSATVEKYKANPDFAPQMSPLAQAASVHNAHAAHAKSHEKSADDQGHGQGPGHDEPHTEAKLLDDWQLWKQREFSAEHQWAMVVDLNACNGCNACVVACQSENNIPSVGKTQVAVGREMNWLRIDRYFTAGPQADLVDDVELAMQPVPCQQCENAPCETVCPVAATTHTPEGLNDMTYNRCIGTRYCSNNCPYKVRRFNYFNFIADLQPTEKMAMNPDVTVRSRGVMEKCTYCVQRINGGKRQATLEGRSVRDGEITPACAQACPPKAITFGNMVDPSSRVTKARAKDVNYAMLSELNVRPRTTYLAKIRNPNPELS